MNWNLIASVAVVIAIPPGAWFLMLWQEHLEARIGTNKSMCIVVAVAVLIGIAVPLVLPL